MQSVYRKHHSTETALLKVTNDILYSMNRQHVSLLILLDISSAFGTVDHTIYSIFSSLFGLSDSSLSWFESYLSDRIQFVSIKGSNSSNIPVQHGIYTCPPFEIIRSHLPDFHSMPTIHRSTFFETPSLLKILHTPPSNLASLRSVLRSTPTSYLSMNPRQSSS